MKAGYYRIYLWQEETKQEREAFHTLFKRGCTQVFIDRLQHPDQARPLLQKLLVQIQPNDIAYVWSFKHLAVTLDQLMGVITQIEEKQARLVVLQDNIHSALFKDRKISDIIALFKETTSLFRREATLFGLHQARQAGRVGGRPISEEARQKAIAAEKLYLNTELPPSIIAKTLKIAKPTFYSYLKQRGIKCYR